VPRKPGMGQGAQEQKLGADGRSRGFLQRRAAAIAYCGILKGPERSRGPGRWSVWFPCAGGQWGKGRDGRGGRWSRFRERISPVNRPERVSRASAWVQGV